jgi:hypothetical protein
MVLNVRLILPLRTSEPRYAREDANEDDADEDGPAAENVSACSEQQPKPQYPFAMVYDGLGQDVVCSRV